MTLLSTDEGLARLHASLEPAEAYRELVGVCEERYGAPPAGAYVAAGAQGLTLDPQCPTTVALPERLELEKPMLDDGLTAIPYRFHGRPLGALVVPAHWQPRSELEELLQQHFAPAFFRAAYLSQTLSANSRASEQLYYLTEMGKLLGVLDLNMLLVNLLELTCSYLGADVGSITLLRDGDLLETAVDWGLPHEAITRVRLRGGRPVVDQALEGREPLLVDAEDLIVEPESPYHFERLLVLPLATNNQALGSINLVAPAGDGGFGPEQLEAVRPGVGLASIAVENAMLVEIKLAREREMEQLALGRKIQSALLPKEPPALEGLQLAAHSEPATMIGGDYFDFFVLPDGCPGLLVADVAGKGVPAGLIMTAARAMFRAAAVKLSQPREILEQVNQLLCAEDFGCRFVTAVLVRVDRERRRLQLASAGHEPAKIYRKATGEVDSPAMPALPLGLKADASYRQIELPFEVGDAVLLYTDGVNEAMNPARQQFGEERLKQTLREGAEDEATALRDRILSAVAAHIGGQPRHDDTTLMIARMT